MSSGSVVSLDAETFKRRLFYLYNTVWNPNNEQSELSPFIGCGALILTLGTSSDYTVYQKTTALFTWLLGYELTETVMAILHCEEKPKVIFLCSHKKAAILETLVDSCRATLDVVVIKREREMTPSALKPLFESISQEIGKTLCEKTDGKTRVALISKDKNSGSMIDEWSAYYENSDFCSIDVTAAVAALLSKKDDTEISLMHVSSKLSSLLMKEVATKRILSVIDGGRKKGRPTHASLSEQIESFVIDGKAANQFKGLVSNPPNASREVPPLKLDDIEVCYPPIIQSGSFYSLKPSAQNTEEPLAMSGAFIVAAGIRYRAYCSNIARTLIIDPLPGQEDQLSLLYALRDHMTGHILRPGIAFNEVYNAGVEFIKHRDPSLISHIPPNFGFSIGLEFRQSEYLLGPRCQNLIRHGMTLNLILGLQDLVETESEYSKYSIMIADTVLITDSSCELLTEGLATVDEVSFSSKDRSNYGFSGLSMESSENADEDRVIKRKLRQSTLALAKMAEGSNSMNERKEHQKMLGLQRVREALQRYSFGESNAEDGECTLQGHKKKELQFESYRKPSSLPKDLGNSKLKVYLDRRCDTVIIPVFGMAVPFHIATIKNITKSEEGQGTTFLRINFNTPTGKELPESVDSNSLVNPHYLKGITVKITGDALHAQEVFKGIQEMRKAAGEREAAARETADLVEQGPLIELSLGQRPSRLTDVLIRPVMDGKKLPGDLEIHANGLRFRSQLRSGSETLEVLFSNIRHLIMQPCDHETIIIVHMHLHHPLMVGKKKTKDIQFYREVLESSIEDTGGSSARKFARFGDEDEIEMEREEKRIRAKTNEEFRTFCDKISAATRGALQAEEPLRELGFSGVPGRQSVLLQPTTDCLVQLVEPPTFLVTLADVEVVFLERVAFGLKNFDMAFVFRDHSRPPVLVTAVPMTQLEPVKDWLDSVDVYFVESKINFNWTNIMKTVAEDPTGFYEMGGWTYLDTSSSGNNKTADDSEAESSEFEEEDGLFEDDEEDEDEDESENESEFEESDDDDEGDEESEGESEDWDVLEEKARIEDERARNRRNESHLPPKSDKKRPEPTGKSKHPPAKRRA